MSERSERIISTGGWEPAARVRRERRISDTPVPIIDVSAAIEGRAMGRVAASVDEACRSIGFLQIVGHGIDLDAFDDVYKAGADLWALPTSEKEALVDPCGHAFYGWKLHHDDAGQPVQERWQMNAVESVEHAHALGIDGRYDDHFHRNRWPSVERLPGFEAVMRRLSDANRVLGARVMAIFAVALGLDEHYFEAAYRNDTSYFTLNAYPARAVCEPGSVSLFEHSDSGTLTLLHQRGEYEGLQVKLPSGERVPVPVVDEALVVNIGDLMARWTNDRWVATRHRVVAGEPGQTRCSLTTFFTPAVDAVVEPLPTCVGPEGTPYGPVTIYEWEPMFLAKTYA